MKKITQTIIITSIIITAIAIAIAQLNTQKPENSAPSEQGEIQETAEQKLHPMSIQALRQGQYKAQDFVIEKQLINGSNYSQYIASYQSETLKIFGLLTVPLAKKLETGFKAIIFVHGYIPPEQYSTTNSYPTYQAQLAKAGFITYKPDLRVAIAFKRAVEFFNDNM